MIKDVLKLAVIPALALAAVPTFGLLFSVGTATPARAGAPRVPDPAATPNPVTSAMQAGLTAKFSAFMSCLGTRTFDARPDISKMEAANNAAGWAATNRDLAAWNAQAAIVDAELARLKPAYGC